MRALITIDLDPMDVPEIRVRQETIDGLAMRYVAATQTGKVPTVDQYCEAHSDYGDISQDIAFYRDLKQRIRWLQRQQKTSDTDS